MNYVVADTKKWEQEAAYHIDTHAAVDSFAYEMARAMPKVRTLLDQFL